MLLRCGTPQFAAGLTSLARKGAWDRRDFTFAFGAGKIGITPEGPVQTLSMSKARAAVRRAFTTWSAVTNVVDKPLEIRFREVDLDDNPDVIVEWVPGKHDAATREASGLTRTYADTLDMSIGTAHEAQAHAAFPPLSVGGTDKFVKEPPVPVHFHDDQPEAWFEDMVESTALHEIGHMLGLEHPEEVAPLPAGVEAIMTNVPHDVTYQPLALFPHDQLSIEELYSTPRAERFNWIWMQGTVDRNFLPGVSQESLHKLIDNDWHAVGFRVIKINAYVVGPDTRYNAIVEKVAADPARDYLTNYKRADFDEVHAGNTAKGMRLIDVNNFIDADGELRFNAVWLKDDIVHRSPAIGLTSDELEAELDKARKAKFRAVLVNGYEQADGEQRWNALFVRQGQLGPARNWKAPFYYTREEFDAFADEYHDQFTPTYFHSIVLPDGRGERWSGIWGELNTRMSGASTGSNAISSTA